jgi:hypothetical protein
MKTEIKSITINGSIGWYDGFYLDYDEKELQQAINKMKLGIDDKIKITISKNEELKIMNKAEEYIKIYTRHYSNEMYLKNKDGSKLYNAWLTPDDALNAVEIAKEEMIEKVCKYISDNMIQSGYTSQTTSEFIKDLKQATK